LVPPVTKAFKIRENWDLAVSYLVFQGETAGMEIQDPADRCKRILLLQGIWVEPADPKASKVGRGAYDAGTLERFHRSGLDGSGRF